MTARVHWWFAMGTGEAVSVPLHRTIVSGVTGLSGKKEETHARHGRHNYPV